MNRETRLEQFEHTRDLWRNVAYNTILATRAWFVDWALLDCLVDFFDGALENV
jgi:hypothetical protein